MERQGKTFILYRGLLDIAHGAGLQHISTELLQIPNESNKNVAIVRATATFVERADGADLLEDRFLTFCGIGDAAPNNVAPAMQTCLIRMAETRAKGRALRDGVNFGEAVFEELGEDEKESEPDRGPYEKPARTTRPKTQTPPAESRAQGANPSEGTSEQTEQETAPETPTEAKAEATPPNLDPKKMREAFWNNCNMVGIEHEKLTQAEAKLFLTTMNGGTYPKDWGVEAWNKLGGGMARYIKAMVKFDAGYNKGIPPETVLKYRDDVRKTKSPNPNILEVTGSDWEFMAASMEQFLKTAAK